MKHIQSISPQRKSQQRKGLRQKKTDIVEASSTFFHFPILCPFSLLTHLGRLWLALGSVWNLAMPKSDHSWALGWV